MTPLLSTALEKIQTRMADSFRATAIQEVRDTIDEKFISALTVKPMQLVGSEVPSVRPGAAPDEVVRILDTQMARDWQETVSGLIEDDITAKINEKTEAVRSMSSVIQDSVLMFQNNPDLIPNTKGYDRELAERFARIASAYEVKTDKGVIGYGVKTQPLINELRAQLSKERGATGLQQQQARSEAQRQAVANQPRQQNGQFDSPQEGIASKTGASGEVEESYDTFWNAVKVRPRGISI